MSKKKKIASLGIAIFLTISVTFALNITNKISLLENSIFSLSSSISKLEKKPIVKLGSGGSGGGGGGGGVTAATNDTNVTGTIAGSTLTLGWTGTLAGGRGGLGIAVTNTANTIFANNGTASLLTGGATTTNFYVTASSTVGGILNIGGATINASNAALTVSSCTGCGGAPSGTDGQTTWYSGTTLTATSSPFIVTTTGHIGWGTTTPTLAPFTFDNGSVTGCEYNLGNQTGTITVNWSLCNQQIMVLTGDNVTINFLNERPGNNLTLIVCQDGTGARTITTWDSKIKWSGVATSTQTGRNGTCDAFSFRSSRGTTTLQDFHTGTSKEL